MQGPLPRPEKQPAQVQFDQALAEAPTDDQRRAIQTVLGYLAANADGLVRWTVAPPLQLDGRMIHRTGPRERYTARGGVP
jgi:hypothetical protein